MKEFRANQGKAGGQLANMPLLLLTTTGAKSGWAITKPLVYTRDGDRIVIENKVGASEGEEQIARYQDWLRNWSKISSRFHVNSGTAR